MLILLAITRWLPPLADRLPLVVMPEPSKVAAADAEPLLLLAAA